MKKYSAKEKRSGLIILAAVALAAIVFWFSLPRTLFDDPLSTVVFDRNGDLLGARIARDGQWRFPAADSVPEKYARAVMRYEDRYFHWHPGINPVSIIRALKQNLQAGEIVSGGSTITMQVIRMSRKNRPRTISQKLAESFLSIRLELTASKDEILKMYANNAPFGGNVVGIEAASWRYFGTSPGNLTWSESALLAVLPNAPSLIHPGRNRQLLKMKRDRLLNDLQAAGTIDTLTCMLAVGEPLPEAPLPLPNLAHHLTNRIMLQETPDRTVTTLERGLQERVVELIRNHHQQLSGNQIHNLACMVMDVETGGVLAYAGNVPRFSYQTGAEDRYPQESAMEGTPERHGQEVDIISSQRSTGSILKPILFAAMLDNGDLLQTSLVPDVPVRFGGYAPKNYNRGYEGAVPARHALERSLNVPSVILLKRYGVEAFLDLLRKMGFTSFSRSHEHYGLTLILGGGETSPWELSGVYSSMARVLNHYNTSDGNYFPGDYRMPNYLLREDGFEENMLHEEGLLGAGSIYLTFKSMLEVNRPEELSLWYLLSSSRNIAWKTGTSYGYRDAWAIGVTPEYLVAVWAGNADGEGRPGLTGVHAAAPLMFDVFSLLPPTTWFEPPLDDLAHAVVCRQSGYLAGKNCLEKDTILVVPKGLRSGACPYHHRVHLDQSGKNRVTAACYPVASMKSESWFVLPPLMELYYKRKDPMYRELPPFLPGCFDETIRQMEIVYPQWNSHLLIPRELDGSKGKVVLEVAHRMDQVEVYWHLDEEYIGSTRDLHRIAVDILPGEHSLTVVDRLGNRETVKFEVLAGTRD